MKVKKDSTTKYQIDFTNATAEFTLILKNNFSPQWRATMIDKSGEKLLSEDDHKRIFEYANSWKIQPEKEKFSILLEYETQNLYTIGRIISLTAFIACLGYVIFTKIHKKE